MMLFQNQYYYLDNDDAIYNELYSNDNEKIIINQ